MGMHCSFARQDVTWPFTLKEGYRLRVLENRVLRRIFGPQKEEVAGVWRRLPNQ
jgi:hypothetical protein